MNKKYRIKDLIEILSTRDTPNKIGAFLTIAMKPTGDPQVLLLVGQHLEDRTLCVMGAPTRYGEIRLMAAQALLAECQKQNIKRSVILKDVVEPLDDNTYVTLRMENNLKAPQDVGLMAGRILVLEELRRLGKLPTDDLEIDV